MTNNEIRKKLIELDTEKLADALLKIAEHNNDEAANLIGYIVATPGENVQRFKNKLQNIRRRKKFISWSGARYFAQELEALLDDLQAGIESPENGIKLMAEFYKSDRFIFEQCDDSNGYVGDVFRFHGNELFVQFAKNCNDKALSLNLLRELHENDDYGVRFSLIESANKFLSEENIRDLLKRFEKEADKYENDTYEKRHWLLGMESLAKQLKDGKLYEKIRLQMSPESSTSTCLDIARVYLESENAEIALSWINKINNEDRFRIHEKDELLFAIYQKLGDQNKMAEMAWILFRRYRNKNTLNQLLDIIGAEKKDNVIKEECAMILNQNELSLNDTEFLIQMNLIDEAEEYILAHREQLNGDNYGKLLPLATGLEKSRKYLSSSIIYRALLDSILRRAQSKYYHHGVRYLKKLDKLALCVSNWDDYGSHQEYLNYLCQKHCRKYSFWDKYNKKCSR